jgi:hypothetical protein
MVTRWCDGRAAPPGAQLCRRTPQVWSQHRQIQHGNPSQVEWHPGACFGHWPWSGDHGPPSPPSKPRNPPLTPLTAPGGAPGDGGRGRGARPQAQGAGEGGAEGGPGRDVRHLALRGGGGGAGLAEDLHRHGDQARPDPAGGGGAPRRAGGGAAAQSAAPEPAAHDRLRPGCVTTPPSPTSLSPHPSLLPSASLPPSHLAKKGATVSRHQQTGSPLSLPQPRAPTSS